jgi:hypothetical protein
MERLFFRKVEVWIVGLLAIIGLVGTIAFGNLVAYTLQGGTKAGKIGSAAVAVSTIPEFLDRLDPDVYFMIPEQFHLGKKGFRFSYEPEQGQTQAIWCSADTTVTIAGLTSSLSI